MPDFPFCYSRYGTDMGRDVRHLHPINLIVSLDCIVETVFPMHRHQQVAILIHKKESALPVNHLFNPWWIPVLNNASEIFCNIRRYRQFLSSRICLCGFNYQFYICSPLELKVNVYIPQSHSAKL